MKTKNAVICPYCQKDAKLVTGDAIYPHRPDLFTKKFWQCSPCGAYVGCHKPNPASKQKHDGTVPLGRLADAELRRAKSNAHAVFDPIWKSGDMKRGDAYRWLAEQLGIESADCHIGMFDVDTCRQVYSICIKRKQEAA